VLEVGGGVGKTTTDIVDMAGISEKNGRSRTTGEEMVKKIIWRTHRDPSTGK